MNDVVLACPPPLAMFDAQKTPFRFFCTCNKRWRFSIKKMFQKGVTFIQWIVGGKSTKETLSACLIYNLFHNFHPILARMTWDLMERRITLLETNSSPLPMDGWSSYFPIGARPIFRGELLVSGIPW